MVRLLLVEDDDLLRGALHESLKRAGYDVITARDGREALQLHQLHPAHLVVSDLLMPGTDGIEILRELRTMKSTLRFIAITGGGHIRSSLYARIATALGAWRVLIKPLDPQELLRVLKEATQST